MKTWALVGLFVVLLGFRAWNESGSIAPELPSSPKTTKKKPPRTVGKMKLGEVAYVVPWAKSADNKIGSHFLILPDPSHSFRMKVQRQVIGYVLWRGNKEKYGAPPGAKESDYMMPLAPRKKLDINFTYFCDPPPGIAVQGECRKPKGKKLSDKLFG